MPPDVFLPNNRFCLRRRWLFYMVFDDMATFIIWANTDTIFDRSIQLFVFTFCNSSISTHFWWRKTNESNIIVRSSSSCSHHIRFYKNGKRRQLSYPFVRWNGRSFVVYGISLWFAQNQAQSITRYFSLLLKNKVHAERHVQTLHFPNENE